MLLFPNQNLDSGLDFDTGVVIVVVAIVVVVVVAVVTAAVATACCCCWFVAVVVAAAVVPIVAVAVAVWRLLTLEPLPMYLAQTQFECVEFQCKVCHFFFTLQLLADVVVVVVYFL